MSHWWNFSQAKLYAYMVIDDFLAKNVQCSFIQCISKARTRTCALFMLMRWLLLFCTLALSSCCANSYHFLATNVHFSLTAWHILVWTKLTALAWNGNFDAIFISVFCWANSSHTNITWFQQQLSCWHMIQSNTISGTGFCLRCSCVIHLHLTTIL